MATQIITKFSSTTTAEPLPGDLVEGELAVNTTDAKLFTKDNLGAVVTLAEPITKAVVDALAVDAGTLDGIDSTGFMTVGSTATDSDALGTYAAADYPRKAESVANISGNWEWQDNAHIRFGTGRDFDLFADGTQLNLTMYDTGGEYFGIYDNGSTVQRFLFRQQGGFTSGSDVPDQDQHRGAICAYGGNAGYSGSYASYELVAESNGTATIALLGGNGGEILFNDSTTTDNVEISYSLGSNRLQILTPGPGKLYFHDTLGTVHSANDNPLDDSPNFGLETVAFNCADTASATNVQLNIADNSGLYQPTIRFQRVPDNWSSPSASLVDETLARLEGSVYDGVALGAGAMNDGVWAIEAVALETHSTTAAGSKIRFETTDLAALTTTIPLELKSASVDVLVPLTEGYKLNAAGATSIDMSLGAYHKMVPSTSKTFTFDNVPATGVAVTLFVEIAPTGTVTITWPASVDWRDGTAPNTPASGATSIYAFITHDGGSTWFGSDYGQAFA